MYAFFDTLFAALPNLLLIFTGYAGSVVSSESTYATGEQTFKSSIIDDYNTSRNSSIQWIPIVNTASGGPLYGSGSLVSPAGDGNYDLYSIDGAHHAITGQYQWPTKLYIEFQKWLNSNL
jgi:hypothetical protein